MNKSSRLLGASAFLALALLALAAAPCRGAEPARIRPFCQVNTVYNNSQIITTFDELYPYYLSKYFSGYNLRYSLNGGEYVDYHSIMPGYQVTREYETTNLGKKQVAIAAQNNRNGSITIALLTMDQAAGTKQYYVHIGNTDASEAPTFEASVKLSDLTQQCYDIDFIDESTVVVGCIDELPQTANEVYQTILYVVKIDGDFASRSYTF